MKIFKKYTFSWLLIIILGVYGNFSCVDQINFGDKFLEKAPGVDVNIDTIFSKGEYAKYFLWNLYNGINCPFYGRNLLNSSPTEILTDLNHSYCGWSGGNENYYPGLITEADQNSGRDKASFTGDRSIWSAVRKGWILIENLDRVPDLSANEKSQLKGETYIIMASCFIDAFKNFGGLPLVDHAFVSGEEFSRGRATTEQTVEFIDSLLQNALDEPGLPWKVEDITTWAGRVTKAGAMALRARLYLFAASPLFNDDQPYMQYTKEAPDQNILHVWNGGKKQIYWDKCRQACEAFFSENQKNGSWFALVQAADKTEAGYCQAFREAYWYRGNSEKIIEVHFDNNYSEWGNQSLNLGNVSHQGHVTPTLEHMEMFGMADGKNYPYKNIYNTNNPDNIDIMVNRDPRLYETMLVPKERLREDYQSLMTMEAWRGGLYNNFKPFTDWPLRFNTGMCQFKWILDYWKMPNVPVSFSHIRMAEMHLIYAEALAETNDLPGACAEMNKVRARVGMDRIEIMNPELSLTSNKENLIKEILRERACELSMENSRLYDIIRRKEVDKFTSPLHELITWRKTSSGEKDTRKDTQRAAGEPWPNFIYDKVQITTGARRWWEPGFWTNKWFLSPLPRGEINKGYGLAQNPGW